MSYYKKRPNNKNKNTIISVIVVILVATLVLSLFGVFSKKDDEYNRVYTTWEVGNIYTGEVQPEYDTYISTGFIEIHDGIKLVYENGFIAQLSSIELYDENKEFLCLMDISEDVTEYSEYSLNSLLTDTNIDKNSVKYVRISIEISQDDDHINFFEMLYYASKIKLYTLKAEN